MIQAQALTYQVGSKTLLQNIHASIPLGQLTAIVGPNGAGKSTLLQCFCGDIVPTSGEVTLAGEPIQDYALQALSQRLAVLSQSTPIQFPFTGLEIVQMGRNPFFQPKHKIAKTDHQQNASTNERAIQSAMQAMQVEHLQTRIFPTLSGGEQQRIQIARVLAQIDQQQAGYLLLDEPTSALDLKHQHRLFGQLKTLATKLNLGICVIVHDLNLAQYYADQVILMKDTQVVASGNAVDTLSPANIQDVFEIPYDFVRYLGHHPEREQMAL